MRDETRFVEVGDRRLRVRSLGEGLPVLYVHGGLGSILEVPDEGRSEDPGQAAKAAGVRLVLVERPGFGESTPQPGRTLADWASDAEAVLDALGLERVGVVGWSGGVPFAVAALARLRGRVAAGALVGAARPPPAVDDEAERGRVALETMRARSDQMLPVLRNDPDAFLDAILGGMTPVDRDLGPELRRRMRASFAESGKAGAAGPVDEAPIYAGGWGNEPGRIGVPVDVWCGELDQGTPPEQGGELARAIPSARLHHLKGRGHHAIYTDATPILAGLAAQLRAAR